MHEAWLENTGVPCATPGHSAYVTVGLTGECPRTGRTAWGSPGHRLASPHNGDSKEKQHQQACDHSNGRLDGEVT